MQGLDDAISAFGAAVTAKTVDDFGEPEEHLRTPLEVLLQAAAQEGGVNLVLAGEDSISDLRVRPDYAVLVDHVLCGHIEVKAPGKGADPTRFRGHDKRQWERLKSLPNVLYTDGEAWAVYRYGEPGAHKVRLSGPADTMGSALAPDQGDLQVILTDFLRWVPVPPRSVQQLASQTAQLCRLLRAEVLELLETDESLRTIADEWKSLLFPDASNEEFADGYAQTVTFALLLARVDGIPLEGAAAEGDLSSVAGYVAARHTLVGTALGILTNPQLTKRFAVSLPALVRVLSVVDWPKLSKGREDRWLLFYEQFLHAYDPELRKASGSYYTPNEVVREMTRMVDDLLRHPDRFNLRLGLADDEVRLVDPAAGSGTFLLDVFRRIGDAIEKDEGAMQVPERLGAALDRIVGFERLVGPYSVAELRLTAELARRGVEVGNRLRLYVADTLDDPGAEQKELGALYAPIAHSRRSANRVKADEPVLVVLGNPPYREKAKGHGGWVEDGDDRSGELAPMRSFFARTAPAEAKAEDGTLGAGPHLKHLYNLYIYFWRWAGWKVFDRHPETPNGVVAFITVAGFVRGQGFPFMRRYLRERADDIWVIDCTPEGHQPPVNTRLFSGVQQPICITIIARNGRTSSDQPARVRYRAISGLQSEKFDALSKIQLDGEGWLDASDEWTESFLPIATGGWATYAPIERILGWSGSGMMPGRTWVVAPGPDVLTQRWNRLLGTADLAEKRALMREHTRDRRIDTVFEDGGLARIPQSKRQLANETDPSPVEAIAYRTLDRQWVIADKRVINQPNPTLWEIRSDAQVFITAPTESPIRSGPALSTCGLVPDIDHFHGRGGRAWPLWRDEAGTEPNLPAGLLDALESRHGRRPAADAVFAYVVGIAGHPGYFKRFAGDLSWPGTRIPITADPDLFDAVAELGRQTVWLQTFGDRMADPDAARAAGPVGVRLPDEERPRAEPLPDSTAPGVPAEMTHDPELNELRFDNRFVVRPLSAEAFAYEVNGMKVLRHWFGYRKADPDGKTRTGLAAIHSEKWPSSYMTELLTLCNVLERLVLLGDEHETLLEKVCDGALVPWQEIKGGITPATKPAPSVEPLPF